MNAKRHNNFKFALLFVINIILVNCSQLDNPQISTYLPTPAISQKAQATFISTVSGNIDLNNSITILRTISSTSNREVINTVSYGVFNHTDENIIFSDQGFGLIVFGYDIDTEKWEELTLPYIPEQRLRALPPKIESWGDLDGQNTWTVYSQDLETFSYKHFRFYVTGFGEVTNKQYGAYLEVTLTP